MIHDASIANSDTRLQMGDLAAQPFDILHEYASGHPPRFASARFRPSTGLGTLSKSKGDEPS
jgi:hypothetical protein